MPRSDSIYEAVVIGGGPAGSAAAYRLARLGRRVLVVERQRFPRFHIGESMLPASNEVLRALGLEARMRSAGFVEKRGATFMSEDGSQSAHIDFSASPDVPSPVTYQVLRSRFDALLLEQAQAAGAEVRQSCRARDAAFAPRGVTLTLAGSEADADDGPRRVRADMVVDASGQAGFLSKRLRLRQGDSRLENVALYAHYEGIPRPPGDRSGDIRIVSRRDLGWIWLIPLSDTLTSVGVVVSKGLHDARPKQSAGDALAAFLAATPCIAEPMRHARRTSEARYEADFCYAPSAYAGDRWLLAGDAGSFLDPVFSSGVLLALESGVEAAEAVDRALASGDTTAASFAGYEHIQRRRYAFFRRLVRGFYDPAFRDLFLTPSDRFGLLKPMINALAGRWRPTLADRWRLEVFFALVALQRWLPIAPRSHDRS